MKKYRYDLRRRVIRNVIKYYNAWNSNEIKKHDAHGNRRMVQNTSKLSHFVDSAFVVVDIVFWRGAWCFLHEEESIHSSSLWSSSSSSSSWSKQVEFFVSSIVATSHPVRQWRLRGECLAGVSLAASHPDTFFLLTMAVNSNPRYSSFIATRLHKKADRDDFVGVLDHER